MSIKCQNIIPLQCFNLFAHVTLGFVDIFEWSTLHNVEVWLLWFIRSLLRSLVFWLADAMWFFFLVWSRRTGSSSWNQSASTCVTAHRFHCWNHYSPPFFTGLPSRLIQDLSKYSFRMQIYMVTLDHTRGKSSRNVNSA